MTQKTEIATQLKPNPLQGCGKRFLPALLLVFLWCLLLPPRSFGQQSSNSRGEQSGLLPPTPPPAITGATHAVWSRRDGAPGGISSLAQTRDGYLWIGSTLGLYRFDGLRFLEYPFDPSDKPLPSLEVSSVAADFAGGLWVSFRDPAIVHLRPDGVRETYTAADGLTANMLEKVIPQPDGNVYAFGGGQIFCLQGRRWMNFGREHGLGRGGVFSVFFDRDGNLWVGRDKRIAVLHPGASTFQTEPYPVHYISSMVQARNGDLWVADAWRNVRRLSDNSPGGAAPIHGKAEMMLDSADNLWIAEDDQGLSRIRDVSSFGLPKQVEHAVPDEISALRTHALLQDREGNVWLGTDRGLDRFQQTKFVPFRATQLHYFPSLAAGDDGSVWINSHGSSLMHVQNGVVTPVGPHVNTGPLARRKNGEICFVDATKNVLVCYDRHGAEEASLDPNLEHDPPISMIADADDSLLASFLSKGLWRWKDGQWSRLTGPGLPQADAWGMLADRGGNLWLGYNDNRIVERHNGVYRTLKVHGGPWSNTLTFYEAAGTLWAAGANGLAFLHEGQLHTVASAQPNLFRGTSGIAQDKLGALWLNSAAGALRIAPAELSALLRDPQHPVSAELFDDNDGLTGQPAQSKRTPSLVADTTGTLWFATGGRVFSLDPAIVFKPRPLPRVLLEQVLLNGQIQKPAAAVLHANAKDLHDLAISYIGIDLSAPERVFYRYRLSGEDDQWQQVGMRRQAFYTRLRPGNYRFEVAASNGQDWSAPVTLLQVAVAPAFYQTWWFRLLCVLAAVAAVILALQVRTRSAIERVRERFSARMRERERVARELHDTLLQGFQGLLLRFDAVNLTIPQGEAAHGKLDEVLRKADHLLVESRDKIKDLRYETLDHDSLQHALDEFGRGLIEPTGCHFHLVVEGTPRTLDPGAYEEINSIAREALTNAARHSGATMIDVLLSFERYSLKLEITDNGHGMDEQVLQGNGPRNHWGMQGMRERAANLRAKLTFKTAPRRGTVVQLRVPGRVAFTLRHVPS